MPLIVKVQPSPKTDADSAEEQRQRLEEASDRNWTRGFTVVTVLLAVLQLGAIGFQVYIASTQNDIIKTQNAIMRRQRKATDTQTRLDHRAWVVVTDTSLPLMRPNQGTEISLTIENVGQSPALDVIAQIEQRFKAPAWPDLVMHAVPDQHCTRIGTLGPGVKRTYTNKTYMTVEQGWSIARGEMIFVRYVFIWYRDIFGQSHTTSACFQGGPGVQGTDGSNPVAIRVADRLNSAN
jgi:hypothetical protein